MTPTSDVRPRIASLVPSLTELLVALGLADYLVARTGFCIHPADVVADIPKVGGTKDVNLAKLARLAPTHVLVNVDENRQDTFLELQRWVPQVIVTHPQTVQDNGPLIDQLCAHFGHLPEVLSRAAALKRQLGEALQRCAAQDWPVQQVLYLIWREPWMSVARDTYIASMLAQVNWHSWPDVKGGAHGAARYPVVQGQEPWLATIDQVLLSSEPYAFGPQHLALAQALCPRARVRLVDGELLSWYGPRAAAGLDSLRALASNA